MLDDVVRELMLRESVCPQCGWPVEVLVEGTVRCECCDWRGESSEVFAREGQTIANHEQFLRRILTFQELLVKQVGPVIGQALLTAEFFPRSNEAIVPLATVLSRVSKAILREVMFTLRQIQQDREKNAAAR